MSDDEKNSSSGSEEEVPKKPASKKKRKHSSESDSDVDRPSPTPPHKKSSNKPEKKKPASKVEEKEPRWDLDNDRFLTVSEFKGRVMVGIREFYRDKASGELKPGKKGISLNPKQWAKLRAVVDEVDAAVKKLVD